MWDVDNTERARIDSGGKLLVGTTTARSNFFNSTNSARFQIEGNGSNSNYGMSIVSNYVGGSNGAQIILAKSGGANVGDTTVVTNGNTLGGLYFQGADGTNFVPSASILARIDGTPGPDDMPGSLDFSTTPNGAESSVLRMRIKNDGRIDMNAGYISLGNVGMKTRIAPNGTGAGIFTTSFGSNVSQTGFIHAVEIGTTKYLIVACYKKDLSSGTTITVIANNGLSVLATNSGGTVTLQGFSDTNNVRMISVINQTQWA
jgi:hypothetical protein